MTMALWDCFKKITVEPVLFLYMFATFMQYGLFQDLVYEKVCITNFNASVCEKLHDPQNKKCLDTVQKDSSLWILSSSVSLALPSILSASFLGSWGDNFGRKFPLCMPSVGGILSSLVYMWMSLYNLSGPLWPILIASTLSGLFGGFVSCIMAVMSYVSNISSQGSRTSRVTLVEAMTFLGGTIGPFAGGGLLSISSHSAVFGCICGCHVLLIFYVLLCVPQVISTEAVTDRPSPYFSLVHIKDSVKTCFKKRDGSKRASLMCFLICSLIIMTATAVPLTSMFSFFCIPALRSLLSKQVEIWELGKMYAFVASVENMCMLLGSVVFNTLYPVLRALEKGLIFHFASASQIVPLIIMMWSSMRTYPEYSNLSNEG